MSRWLCAPILFPSCSLIVRALPLLVLAVSKIVLGMSMIVMVSPFSFVFVRILALYLTYTDFFFEWVGRIG